MVTIQLPQLNVNDETAVLVNWLYADKTLVSKNAAVCVVETTKSAVDICVEQDGFLRCVAVIGTTYHTGDVLGFITDSIDEPLPDLTQKAAPVKQPDIPENQPLWTKKAQILANRFGIDMHTLSTQYPGTIINEEIVQTALQKIKLLGKINPVKQESFSAPNSWGMRQERVLILGGGGGAELVLDILLGSIKQVAVGILDNKKAVGTSVMDVPILGNFDLAVELWQSKKFDALISTVVRDINDRCEIFERFTQASIPFTNIIAPTASIRSGVKMGTGNLIVHGCYLATGVCIGNNNFLAAGTYIEHHSIIGSHCTFGPRTSLSGKVTVENKVKFGTHVAVEPFINIGTESIIASGVALTAHIPAHTIVKNAATPVIRHANQ